MSFENDNTTDFVDIIEDIDGFWDEDLQKLVQGKVMGINLMLLANRETMVAIIMLTAPCKAVVGSKSDKEEITLEPGQAIGVVVKHKLSSLYTMVQNNCEVKIEAREKITLPNANTMWRYAIACRGRRTLPQAPGQKRPAPAQNQGSKTKDQSADMDGF